MSPAFVNAPVALTGSRAAPCVTSAFTGARPAVRVARVSRATVRASDGEIEEELSWVDAIAVDEITVGALHRRVVVGLDLVFVCDNDGQVYVLGNKGTPLGTPLTGGSIFTDELVCSFSSSSAVIRARPFFDIDNFESDCSFLCILRPFLLPRVCRT